MNRQSQSYAYFLTESQDILQTIEQGLFRLRTDRTPAAVHELMRAAHTLKGAAASVSLDAISSVAHVLEDIFQAFHNPELAIDNDVEGLLFEGYECLRLLVNAQQTGAQVDEADLKNRAADIIVKLQTKLGDRFDRAVAMPTSSELGFDMVQSIFEMGVAQRLATLTTAVQTRSPDLATELHATAEIFLGLGESLNLPGFTAIAQTTLDALTRSPDHSADIAQIALTDFTQAQRQVLAGDRAQGGKPSAALRAFTTNTTMPANPVFDLTNLNPPTLHPTPESLDIFEQTASPPPPTMLSPTFESVPSSHVPADQPPPRSELSKLLHTELRPDRWWRSLTAWLRVLVIETTEEAEAPAKPIAPPPAPTLEALLGDPVTTPDNPPFTPAIGIPTIDAPVIAPPDPSFWQTPPLAPPAPPAPAAAPTPPHPHTPTPLPTATIRVDLPHLEKLNYLTSELLLSQNQQTSQQGYVRLLARELLTQLQKHRQTLNTLTRQADRLSQPQRQTTSSVFSAPLQQQFDALELDRYSDVQVLAQNALNQMAEIGAIAEAVEQTYRSSHTALESQQRLLLNLNNDLTTIRMQPLDGLFQRLAQVLQQLSSSHHKPITVVLQGTQVLVDKAIVDKLYDPLLHLVRNAFDHGIEAPDVRRAKGKPAAGSIAITAYHQGNSTVIDVKDDGAGIDRQLVAQQAIAAGLLQPDAATTTDAQLLSVLFQPGFSTTAQVNELSGRGVGLDVVQTELTTLKGRVTVRSEPQQGTVFSLHLPFTLTIAKLLVCQANDILYALPLEDVKQVIMPHPEQLSGTAPHTVLHWQQGTEETTIVVRSLTTLLGYSEQAIAAAPSKPKAAGAIVLLQLPTGLTGIQVDRVDGEQELVIRPFSTALPLPPYVYGCSLMGNNQLALVLDIKTLLNQTSPTSPTSLASPTLPPIPSSTPPPHAVRILLIEDSLTIRHTLAAILQQAGYEVAQAQDGLDALSYLEQQPQVDLMICDLEMPRMNGFEFLSQRRQQQAISQIPVMILTSRSTEKHRQLALELGAAAFITKPYSDRAMLAAIDHLLAASPKASELLP